MIRNQECNIGTKDVNFDNSSRNWLITCWVHPHLWSPWLVPILISHSYSVSRAVSSTTVSSVTNFSFILCSISTRRFWTFPSHLATKILDPWSAPFSHALLFPIMTLTPRIHSGEQLQHCHPRAIPSITVLRFFFFSLFMPHWDLGPNQPTPSLSICCYLLQFHPRLSIAVMFHPWLL